MGDARNDREYSRPPEEFSPVQEPITPPPPEFGSGRVSAPVAKKRALMRRLLGVTARTAYNVDSFGHNAMLPQIFKKSGMSRYVMMRPGQHEKEMACSDLWIY